MQLTSQPFLPFPSHFFQEQEVAQETGHLGSKLCPVPGSWTAPQQGCSLLCGKGERIHLAPRRRTSQTCSCARCRVPRAGTGAWRTPLGRAPRGSGACCHASRPCCTPADSSTCPRPLGSDWGHYAGPRGPAHAPHMLRGAPAARTRTPHHGTGQHSTAPPRPSSVLEVWPASQDPCPPPPRGPAGGRPRGLTR